MNLDVLGNINENKLNDTECILCGNCIDNCKHKVIKYSMTK